MAPTSRFEKPATRVYSSPKPTQPDSNTIGEDSASPQKRLASSAGWSGNGAPGVAGVAAGAVFMAANYRLIARRD